jgi:phage N-6-adenine-methyltransferase
MTNKYTQALNELRGKASHELKEIGDQWCTPDNIFWGINAMFGPLVLDLFTDGENSKCPDFYTAEDNALTHDWSERLAELNGAAFANPPYSRAMQHDDVYITGMRHIVDHTMAMREKGGRYVILIKAATSEVWWPENADHIAFIRGRIGFDVPKWFIPKDEKQVPSGAFFAGAVAVFDKNWNGPQPVISAVRIWKRVVMHSWHKFAVKHYECYPKSNNKIFLKLFRNQSSKKSKLKTLLCL